MTKKSLLTYNNLSTDEFFSLIDKCELFYDKKHLLGNACKEKIVGTLFTVSSTRTRASFSSATLKLGAKLLNFAPTDLQINTGETMSDTGRVLGQYVDALVVRTNGSLDHMRDLSNGVSLINAMSACEHPSQVLGDYIAMQEHFGRKENFEIAYFGEGNNTAVALAYFFSRLSNIKIDFYMPTNYGLPKQVIDNAKRFATNSGAVINIFHEFPNKIEKVDIIYTSRWQTMGVAHTDHDWKDQFNYLRVDSALFEKFARSNKSVLMHDLPAVRGDEVTSDILDGPSSIAFRQAYHKITGAAGCLLWLLT